MNVATILAAGLGSRFGDITKYIPKGMIKVGDKPMIEYSIDKLKKLGYSEILVVTGHCSDVYDNFFKKWDNVKTIKNPFYKDTGSLFSLYLAMSELRKYNFKNLTILDSDIIYDYQILNSISSENCMIVSEPKSFDIGDECWAHTKKHDGIEFITEITKTKPAKCEMIGISNITTNSIKSIDDYESMIKLSLDMLYKNNLEDYENMLSKFGNFRSVKSDYLWAEMDNVLHMEYATENILPKIK
jgi:choline kinase